MLPHCSALLYMLLFFTADSGQNIWWWWWWWWWWWCELLLFFLFFLSFCLLFVPSFPPPPLLLFPFCSSSVPMLTKLPVILYVLKLCCNIGDKDRLDGLFRKAFKRGLCSDVFHIDDLARDADTKLFGQASDDRHCMNTEHWTLTLLNILAAQRAEYTNKQFVKK